MSATPFDSSLAGVHRLVWIALCAALMTVGAYAHVPLWGVPFSMQIFFALMAGMLLGPLAGAGSMALYVAAGAMGLPVFAGGKAGLAVLVGPTGGYLVGFILAAAIMGLARRGAKEAAAGWLQMLIMTLGALAVVYILGVTQLKFVLNLSWHKAVTVGFFPFILFDVMKAAGAVTVYRYMRAKGLAPA